MSNSIMECHCDINSNNTSTISIYQMQALALSTPGRNTKSRSMSEHIKELGKKELS